LISNRLASRPFSVLLICDMASQTVGQTDYICSRCKQSTNPTTIFTSLTCAYCGGPRSIVMTTIPAASGSQAAQHNKDSAHAPPSDTTAPKAKPVQALRVFDVQLNTTGNVASQDLTTRGREIAAKKISPASLQVSGEHVATTKSSQVDNMNQSGTNTPDISQNPVRRYSSFGAVKGEPSVQEKESNGDLIYAAMHSLLTTDPPSHGLQFAGSLYAPDGQQARTGDVVVLKLNFNLSELEVPAWIPSEQSEDPRAQLDTLRKVQDMSELLHLHGLLSPILGSYNACILRRRKMQRLLLANCLIAEARKDNDTIYSSPKLREAMEAVMEYANYITYQVFDQANNMNNTLSQSLIQAATDRVQQTTDERNPLSEADICREYCTQLAQGRSNSSFSTTELEKQLISQCNDLVLPSFRALNVVYEQRREHLFDQISQAKCLVIPEDYRQVLMGRSGQVLDLGFSATQPSLHNLPFFYWGPKEIRLSRTHAKSTKGKVRLTTFKAAQGLSFGMVEPASEDFNRSIEEVLDHVV